jgi:hypothetical protein
MSNTYKFYSRQQILSALSYVSTNYNHDNMDVAINIAQRLSYGLPPEQAAKTNNYIDRNDSKNQRLAELLHQV